MDGFVDESKVPVFDVETGSLVLDAKKEKKGKKEELLSKPVVAVVSDDDETDLEDDDSDDDDEEGEISDSEVLEMVRLYLSRVVPLPCTIVLTSPSFLPTLPV